MSINLGNRIRELRKEKGITQEQLASSLNISAQAVSKWEMGTGYPDMSLIPVIAGYFEVSLDILFDYDVSVMKKNIETIISDAWEYFFDDTERFIKTVEDALKSYPGSNELLEALACGYERLGGHSERLVEVCHKLIAESRDITLVCKAKEMLAKQYIDNDDYQRGKEILETLPEKVICKNDSMARLLKDKDKVNASAMSWSYHIQPVYEACLEQGDGWYHMEEHGVVYKTISTEEYLTIALKCYRRGSKVIEAFLDEDHVRQHSYVWPGMQTFHYIFYQRMAACYKRMGITEECVKAVEEAYRIIERSWDDFETKCDYYMEPFYQYLREYDLDEYIK